MSEQIAVMELEIAMQRAALVQALDSLEYIKRAHPEITGSLQRETALGMVRHVLAEFPLKAEGSHP